MSPHRAATLALLVPFLSVSAGCVEPGDENSGVDPFAGDCDFPQIDDIGNNSALVGGVATPDDQRLQDVEVIATPHDSGLDERRDVTNEAGCYYLGLEPDTVYDVTWSKDGYGVDAQDAVRVPAGEKRIQHVYLRPI